MKRLICIQCSSLEAVQPHLVKEPTLRYFGPQLAVMDPIPLPLPFLWIQAAEGPIPLPCHPSGSKSVDPSSMYEGPSGGGWTLKKGFAAFSGLYIPVDQVPLSALRSHTADFPGNSRPPGSL